jgi:hypothetical protein
LPETIFLGKIAVALIKTGKSSRVFGISFEEKIE